jgi:hypothetical protein
VPHGEALRAHPGGRGSDRDQRHDRKRGVTLWSTRPAERGFASRMSPRPSRRERSAARVDQTYAGAARASYTVLYEGDVPTRGIAVVTCPRADALAATDDPSLVAAMAQAEVCGREAVCAVPECSGVLPGSEEGSPPGSGLAGGSLPPPSPDRADQSQRLRDGTRDGPSHRLEPHGPQLRSRQDCWVVAHRRQAQGSILVQITGDQAYAASRATR